MPKDKYAGTDPDPRPFLYVSPEQKRADQTKPYDAKKSCWVPDEKEGFVEGEIRKSTGEQITVAIGIKEKVFKKDQVSQVNPPKFEKCEDMSSLTYLNDASVLWNMKDRYFVKLIYTYSGLFCVSVNPYERFPIYTERCIRMYQGKRRTEMPPHIFSVSDGAYRDMLNNLENQSMLITGESGAGKTENTKKVISYFASVGANAYKVGEVKKANLEDQVVQTNPVLEAFGNAKTVRNDNSSRFGKFIRIHFTEAGKLAGADIETYLLEKARVISQQPMERSYHIFYQIMSDAIPGLKGRCNLEKSFDEFPNQSMGKTEIEGVDDKEEMEITDNCMDVLGFTSEEKESVYRIVAAVMHLGTMKFRQRGREEQAEADGTKEGEIFAQLLEVDCDDLYRNLLKPKIKVGNEFVTQGRNKDQVFFSIGALSKAMYDRLFIWLVQRCNVTLASKQKKQHFIGVLDIAGFEIFEFNSFEQLCINFTNEKLQQFFNHHMFVLEQEEYTREGIAWTFIDFGMDLQACIDLIEKPLGVFSILEEESMFPKASDKTFEEKLMNNHMSKSANFSRPKGSGGKDHLKDAHFAITHYAGTVSYNVTGWLEKNKDPLNDSVVDQFKKGSNVLLSAMFSDVIGGEVGEKKAKRSKGSTFQTVSALYREQVENLMATLRATAPHFIRCIIPNEQKAAGVIDAPLVMHQLTCNGVLEGIRICRKGFPNRMHYKDFRERYAIIAAKDMSEANDKAAAAICFAKIGLEEEQYRLGHTKVFFRSGVIGFMEEKRDERIQELVSALQGQCRAYFGQKRYNLLCRQRDALVVIQRVLRLKMNLRLWLWWKLWSSLKPLLQIGQIEDRIKELEEKVKAQQMEMVKEEKQIKAKELELAKAMESKQKALKELEAKNAAIAELEAMEAKWKEEALRRQEEVQETQERLAMEEEARQAVEQAKKKADQEVKELKKDIDELEIAVSKAEQDRASKDHQIRCLNDEIQQQDHMIAKVTKEKKMLQENQQKTAEDLQVAEDKNNHLTKLKNKLESTLDDMEDALEKEKRARVEQDKARRKVESDLKLAQSSIENVERAKKEIEASLQRKDKELGAMADKLEEEQAEVVKSQKQMKDMALRMDDLEDELESERGFRAKADKQRSELSRELEELHDRLEEAGGATAAQIELNKKRESEMAKMKRDLEEASIQQEAALASLRKKHGESMLEINEQMESQNRTRQKLEKEKASLLLECKDAQTAADRLASEKAAIEKDQKLTLTALNDIQARYDESQRSINDLDTARKKLSIENLDLTRHLEEAESQVAQLNKLRVSYSTQLENVQRMADDEAKERAALQSRFRHVESERDSIRQTLEDELEAKSELQRQLSRATGDATMWRAKYETESVSKIEDLEHAKLKLQARLAEAEDTIEGLTSRCVTLEKAKQKYATEAEDMQMQVDTARNQAIQLEKRTKNFDKVIAEWKQKLDELTAQLESCQKDYRDCSSDLYRARASLEEVTEQLEASRRENKNLGLEVKDLLEQIGDGGRSLHEIEKQCRRLEEEKEELANALDEAEAALEQEENRTLRYQLEIAQSRQEIDRRIQEKEEEFENVRKTSARMIDSLQASLEGEAKGRTEALRVKKKLEADIQELEVALDHASKINVDLQKSCKRYQGTARELQQSLDDSEREKEALKESVAILERKANGLANDVEESRTFLEQAERGKRALEQELADCKEQLNISQTIIQELSALKRKQESELMAAQADLDEAGNAVRNSDEKAKKAILDAMRLADELRLEQERARKEEQLRKTSEAQIKDLQIQLEEIETNGVRGGRKTIEKLEAKVRGLTTDLDCEHRWKTEYMKNFRKAERRLKEIEFQLEEERKSYEKLQDLCDKLQLKLRNYKKQVEDAEEIAALNLAKFRKAQSELEEADQRANLAEHALNKVRAKSIFANSDSMY